MRIFRTHGTTRKDRTRAAAQRAAEVDVMTPNWIGERPTQRVEHWLLHVRPFSARSLVGMTMGARKRAALYDAARSGAPPISNRKLHLCLAPPRPKTMCLEDWRRECRSKYRIGERLRPCPGCWHCQTTWQQSSIYPQTAVVHRHGCSHDDPSGVCCFGETISVTMECDGSGVLPARRKGSKQ